MKKNWKIGSFEIQIDNDDDFPDLCLSFRIKGMNSCTIRETDMNIFTNFIAFMCGGYKEGYCFDIFLSQENTFLSKRVRCYRYIFISEIGMEHFIFLLGRKFHKPIVFF